MPISPLARECLFKAYSRMITMENLQKEFDSIKKTLNPITRGYNIEQLFITLISLKKLSKVQIEHFDSKGLKDNISFEFKDFDRVNFGGYFTPSFDPDTKLKNTLFVPEVFNYPGFDFIYYESNQDTALFFNVTIKKKCVQHVKDNDANAQDGATKAGTLPPAMRVR